MLLMTSFCTDPVTDSHRIGTKDMRFDVPICSGILYS